MDPNDIDRPSTSKEISNFTNLDENAGKDTENVESLYEADPDNAILNETLETFAKTYNLTAQNVKNIIYHIVKNPQTFSTLIGKDTDAISTLRMTRSRLRELERIAQVKLGIELKPVNAARTFLDVNYDDNDEEDVDYRPEEMEDNMDADDVESDFPESNADWGELVEESWNELVDGSELMPIDLLTSVNDPDYLNFLKSVAAPQDELPHNDDDDVEDDDEFNIIQHEMDFIEEEEFRMDRTTKIPRWELDALREDWLISDPLKHQKPRKRSREPRSISALSRTLLEDGEVGASSKALCQKGHEDVLERRSSDCEGSNTDEIVEIFANIPSSSKEENASFEETISSCPLLEPNVHFTEDELKTLRIQLEKHAQLLTQCIVGTHGDDKLLNCRNKALEMIHTLDGEFHARAFDSLFHVSTLPDAIYSCHDILACQGVELPPNIRTSYYLSPKSEVMWVFARCKAFKYPQLVSDVLLQHFDAPHSAFFPSEQILLALALFQLFHVKHSSWNNTNGKYQLIADYFLCTRTVPQIRYHLKNVRASTSKSPINGIILEAQHTGILIAKFVLDSEGRNAQSGPPMVWPTKFQPEWLKKLALLFTNGQIHVLPRNASPRMSEVMGEVEVCVKKNVGIIQNNAKFGAENDVTEKINEIEVLAHRTEFNGEENSLERDVAICSEDVSNDITDFQRINERNIVEADDVDISSAPADNTKQKSRRKIRVEKCVGRLCNLRAREESLQAVVEAVNQDLKQRLFMHQDKLKEVYLLLLRKDLSVKQIFDLLSTKLSGEHHANALALIASLAPDTEFATDSALYNDSRRLAYRQALEMLVNSHTYLTGCRSSQGVRNAFKNIKEVADSAYSGEICDKLKHHCGARDDPLWRILRTQIPSEKFNERVEDWQYEYIDVDSLRGNKKENSTYNENLKFESVNLPYKYDPTERGRLRLRHGRLTMEHNGRLKTVNVGFTTDRGVYNGDGIPNLPTTAAPWTREDDEILLVSFQKFNGDMQKTIDDFLSKAKTTNVSALEASRRLAFLIGMMKRVNGME